MTALSRSLACVLLTLGACAPHREASPPATPPQTTCAVRIEEPTLPPPSPPALPEIPASEIVVGISLDTATLTRRLGEEVPPRVAHGRNVDAGVAGRLSFRIDRSPFSVAIRGRNLVISTQLDGQADLCKPLGPLGCVHYAECSPRALATASIPLSLGPAYRPGPASVHIQVTRPCEIGGVDASAHMQKEAHRQARRLEARVNALLPSFAKDAQALWNAMGVHVPLGIDSRLRISPSHVVEGPARDDGSSLTIPLGVRADLRIEPRQGERDDPGPIPPPRFEPELPSAVQLHVPIEVDVAGIDASLSRSVRDVSDDAPKILSVRSQPDADGLRLLLSVKGYSCGTVAFRATPVFHEGSGRLRLSEVAPLSSEVARVKAIDPDLDLVRIARAVEARASIPLPVDPSTIPLGLERAVELLAPKQGPEVRLQVRDATVRSVTVTPQGVAVIVHLQGQAHVVL
jgi:hypothetical protein